MRMSRVLLFVAALAAVLPGCGTVQKAYNDLTSNHYYNLDGYRIDGPYAFFERKKEPDEGKMTLGFAYGQKILFNQGCDATVDRIEFKNENYRREMAGAEDLFRQADEEWAYCWERMHIADTEAKWREMNESNIAQTGGYSKYKH